MFWGQARQGGGSHTKRRASDFRQHNMMIRKTAVCSLPGDAWGEQRGVGRIPDLPVSILAFRAPGNTGGDSLHLSEYASIAITSHPVGSFGSIPHTVGLPHKALL